ncbi:hypothetical protein GGX14DRAFT_618286 [Mycena pura]|uniref:NmrA-like domain-containing protein n=1 Tax=Mycena pura TaxID=153505 RepID=A0AAD6VMP8_9AGAR|nr:hypothetical protein GGX14DRAFT_618286 [Mycena pura]
MAEISILATTGRTGSLETSQRQVRHARPSRRKGQRIPDFRYTLILTGPFTEFAVSSFNGVDIEKHTAEPYGRPGAELAVTAMSDVMYIVESILIPFDAAKNGQVRELRVPGEARITWEKLIEYHIG